MKTWTRPRAAPLATAAIGTVMVAVPATGVRAAAYLVTAAGVLAVLAAIVPALTTGHCGCLPWAGTAAVTAAVAQSAIGSLGPAALAAEGLLIVSYLLLLDAPPRMDRLAARRWAAGQVPGLLGACAVTGVVLAALAIPRLASAWIALAGLAAAAVAYLIAVDSPHLT